MVSFTREERIRQSKLAGCSLYPPKASAFYKRPRGRSDVGSCHAKWRSLDATSPSIGACSCVRCVVHGRQVLRHKPLRDRGQVLAKDNVPHPVQANLDRGPVPADDLRQATAKRVFF